jgi:hypothetical protein
VIRQVAGERESPWKGSLVCGPAGELGVMVNTALLGAQWRGWDAAAAGHVLGPLEIIRRPGGHDVLLPVCTERLDEFLSRRAATGAELSAGECVTVAVSLLRGLADLRGAQAPVRGTWWLTDEGRPVFATDSGQTGIEETTAELLGVLGRDVPGLGPDIDLVLEAACEPRRSSRELDRAEALLFAVADPLPLATTTFGPRSVRSGARPDQPVPAAEASVERAWPFTFARHLDADWADLVSRTTTGLWRRVRTRRPGSRRPWLVAGGLAAAILAGGLMWPTGPGGPATADTAPMSDDAIGTPSPTPAAIGATEAGDAVAGSADGTATPPGPADLAAVAGALLDTRAECATEPACLASVVEPGSMPLSPGVADLPPTERTVTLLDDFGGAAVLRVEAPGGMPQFVVIVQSDDRWLLRDIYDAAPE